MYFAFLLLSCGAAYRAMRSGKCVKGMIPILSICGIIVFLCMWEVTGRYPTNFFPLILMCAVYGMPIFFQSKENPQKKPFAQSKNAALKQSLRKDKRLRNE